jgi:hypothetical protein
MSDSKLKAALRTYLSLVDQMDELKTDMQSMEFRMLLLQPYIQKARKQIEILRECLEEEQEAGPEGFLHDATGES